MFLEIGKYLAAHGIEPSLCVDYQNKQIFWNLQTQAKSDLYLYEDMTLKGRYGYVSKLDGETLDENIGCLCMEFKNCLHGRDYGSVAWFKLCENF